MQFPYQNLLVSTSQNTVALNALVPAVVNAINTNLVIPYGDYGGPTVYYFTTQNNGLGNFIYTMFDKETNLGLASFSVRYGAATTIRDIILMPFPRSQIDLQFLILPKIPYTNTENGFVTP
jgi:O-antigen/teichoic acid export membrane protein